MTWLNWYTTKVINPISGKMFSFPACFWTVEIGFQLFTREQQRRIYQVVFGVVFWFCFFFSLEIFCVALKVPNHYRIDLCIKKGMLGKEQEFPWLLSPDCYWNTYICFCYGFQRVIYLVRLLPAVWGRRGCSDEEHRRVGHYPTGLITPWAACGQRRPKCLQLASLGGFTRCGCF